MYYAVRIIRGGKRILRQDCGKAMLYGVPRAFAFFMTRITLHRMPARPVPYLTPVQMEGSMRYITYSL